jgi:hypothetical protein
MISLSRGTEVVDRGGHQGHVDTYLAGMTTNATSAAPGRHAIFCAKIRKSNRIATSWKKKVIPHRKNRGAGREYK